MSFADEIKTLAGHVPERVKKCKTEEATKAALIQPFIRALGYDVNNPVEVVPEFTADVSLKYADRVDYAIMKDGKPIMLFECKAADSNLNKDDKWSQLFKYFIATDAKFGVLTNGVDYQFFSDLDQRNKMDKRPFLEFNLAEPMDDSLISDVEKFSKEYFNPRANWNDARKLKYTTGIKKLLSAQLNTPSEKFIKSLALLTDFDMRMPKSVKQQLPALTKQVLNQFIVDQAHKRLNVSIPNGNGIPTNVNTYDDGAAGEPEGTKATATEEELQGYYMVKAILRDTVDVKRIFIRDVKAYCGVLFDDNDQKPICRLRFNAARKKYLGLFGAGNREERVALESLDDIYKYADRLKARVRYYVKPSIAA